MLQKQGDLSHVSLLGSNGLYLADLTAVYTTTAYYTYWRFYDNTDGNRFYSFDYGRMLARYFCSFCCFTWILISFLRSAVLLILSSFICLSISRCFICSSLSSPILLSATSRSWCISTLFCSRSLIPLYRIIKWKKPLLFIDVVSLFPRHTLSLTYY